MPILRSLIFVALTFNLSCGTATKSPQAYGPQQIVSWNFDWDDNIAFMPTKVYIFHSKTGEEKTLTTGEFATERSKIGKSGPLKDYELNYDNTNGSFREFRDGKNINYFVRDVNHLLSLKSDSWKGPSFPAFQKALSTPETAQFVTIITARGHAPETLLAGIRTLQAKGLVKELPPKENLFGVSHPSLQGKASSPSAVKVKIMLGILDKVNSTSLPIDSEHVLDPNGKVEKPLHLWGFSDDDHKNYKKAVEIL